MNTKSHHRARTSGSVAGPSLDLSQRLSRLYELAQESDHIFGSPLGPVYDEAQAHFLPRFVYFGPHTSQESLRLAVLAGFDRRGLPAAHALTSFVEGLARQPDIGHGLNLSFFPVVNVLDLLAGGSNRNLAGEHWGNSTAPEIQLLNQDTRLRGYQGFLRIVTTTDDVPAAWVRTAISASVPASGVELFDSEHFHPWSVRFETVSAGAVAGGPLSIADDLPFAPFEVELALPTTWSQAQADKSLAVLLKRLVVHFRGFHAYGQNL